MNKSSLFSGQPVLAQLISLIPASLVTQLSTLHGTDRYYKTFKSWDHLVAMLYSCFHNCTSLREVVSGMEASYNKLAHLRLQHIPRRSTLADANCRRTAAFFQQLYEELYKRYYTALPDSRRKKSIESRLFIMDSTTITLFSDIMKGAGSYKANGRKKGGVKAHVLLAASHAVPQLICLTEGARNDRVFMKEVRLDKGSILVFDKGYHHFAQWQQWTDQGINWVTRLIETEVWETLCQNTITEEEQRSGVCADQHIRLGRGSGPGTIRIMARLVSYYAADQRKVYHFVTNNFEMKASTIAAVYRRRWQIELFFKRLKQTNALHSFLGDNENAICIQLWCTFIKDLLIKIVKDGLKRHWSFSNLASMIRHHLMNYLDLTRFLNYPDRLFSVYMQSKGDQTQLPLFPT